MRNILGEKVLCNTKLKFFILTNINGAKHGTERERESHIIRQAKMEAGSNETPTQEEKI